MAKSIEEQVEDWAKEQLNGLGIHYYSKNENINDEIGEAMEKYPSKLGGKGKNYPDIQLLIEPNTRYFIPVMIEVKGTKGSLAKTDENGNIVIENIKPDGKPDYSAISKYAMNGAVHYAEAIIRGTKSYTDVIAIGINGWKNTDDSLHIEMGVYFVSKDNFCIPKEIAQYTDLSFLEKCNLSEFMDKIGAIGLSDEEKEKKAQEVENLIERNLQDLNQKMRDELQISENMRVPMVAGMIMAGLGVEDKVSQLDITELKGNLGETTHDGAVIHNRIASYLAEKNLPNEKRKVIIDVLAGTFLGSKSLYAPRNGESPLKTVYRFVHDNILPYYTSKHHLDFTGRLFNVLNSWIKVPDGAQNDVVLTPRYVTDLMARLAQVNKDSYVWDYATGSAGFLISAMKLMIADAKEKIQSPNEYVNKVLHIKGEQLLGIEKLPDVYLLAILNMILMGDGSSNIIHADSLRYDGKYEQGDLKGNKFPADVFLLNPPYSSDGKGFVFVEKALSLMEHGRAAVLIQESAGNGSGLPYTKNILKKNTLLASIRMADIFMGKASVQTAIYVFEVGKPHNKKQIVRFIDFSDDGYTRANRKKSSLSVNLRNTGNAEARYQEVVNVVLYGSTYLKLISPECFIEDTISLEGNDWTFQQHRHENTSANFDDFQTVIKEHLAWQVSKLLKSNRQKESQFQIDDKPFAYKKFKIRDFFDIHPTKAYKLTNKKLFETVGDVPVLSNSSRNNGIAGYVNLKPTEDGNIITFSDTTTSEAIFYQPLPFIGYPHVQGLYPKNEDDWNENRLLYFLSIFKANAKGRFDYAAKFTRVIALDMEITLPITEKGKVDFEYMEKYIKQLEAFHIKKLEEYLKDLESPKKKSPPKKDK